MYTFIYTTNFLILLIHKNHFWCYNYIVKQLEICKIWYKAVCNPKFRETISCPVWPITQIAKSERPSVHSRTLLEWNYEGRHLGREPTGVHASMVRERKRYKAVRAGRCNPKARTP